ncbi:MAG: 23S rRNA (uracil(1939)-C(5))-methyltransferase RlmD [Clostridiales Family XIII bacterium]|jgi:23S rRNA (uracil-5-)-methyltransferase RumA|nr:23S rRNA (uracil(1939)-C(5))-methyltransferase RlmD [Clostridiales Family XIII bacterium]
MTQGLCPHAEICGGCTYQGVPYAQQLERKNEEVLNYLLQSKLLCGEYTGSKPSPHIYAYRNKMEYSFGDEVKEGPMTLGLHRKKSYMSVIETDGCQIVPPDFDLIRRSVLTAMRASGHSFHHKRTHKGFLRFLVLRRGENTGQLLINLVTTDEETLDAEAFVNLLLSLETENRIVGILHTIYNGRADVVASDEMRLLYGVPYYEEKMMNRHFRVNALSFFQTNTAAVERMFTEALEMIPVLEEKKVFDLYCGTGAISLALSGKAKEVIGIEIVAASVHAAKENATRNNVSNCRFLEGDAFEVLEGMNEHPDLIVVDPPRMGMHPKALKKIIGYRVDEILYISCNPKTFAQNAAVLTENGYRLDVLKVYDNFPFTKHIELSSRFILRER